MVREVQETVWSGREGLVSVMVVCTPMVEMCALRVVVWVGVRLGTQPLKYQHEHQQQHHQQEQKQSHPQHHQ